MKYITQNILRTASALAFTVAISITTLPTSASAAVDINRIGGAACYSTSARGDQLFVGTGANHNYYTFTTRKILLDVIAALNNSGYLVVESTNPVPGADAYCYFYAY